LAVSFFFPFLSLSLSLSPSLSFQGIKAKKTLTDEPGPVESRPRKRVAARAHRRQTVVCEAVLVPDVAVGDGHLVDQEGGAGEGEGTRRRGRGRGRRKGRRRRVRRDDCRCCCRRHCCRCRRCHHQMVCSFPFFWLARREGPHGNDTHVSGHRSGLFVVAWSAEDGEDSRRL